MGSGSACLEVVRQLTAPQHGEKSGELTEG